VLCDDIVGTVCGGALKILHVLPTLNPNYGGPTEGVRQNALYMPTIGHSVEVVTLDSVEQAASFGFLGTVHAMGPARGGYRFSWRLVRWIREHAHRFDAVVINGIWQFNCFGTWLGLRKAKTPYFVFTHGMLDPWFKRTYPLKHLKKWLYWPWAVYPVLRDAEAVLFTCEEERRLARHSFWLYRVREKVVKYGAASPPAEKHSLREQFFSTYSGLRGRRLILFLGRVHVKKGCDLLIDAFARVQSLDPDLHLVIAGPGDEKLIEGLKTRAAQCGLTERISWLGMLTGPAKWAAFYSCEVFALPSHQENFGIAVAEALGCGLPVLISDKVNIWREIQSEAAGYVAPDTLEGTEQNLRRWLALSVDERRAFSDRASAAFLRNYTTAASCASLANAIAASSLRF
jgi:glycosyltransferase involved in cell wall biosynthesis